MKIRGTPLHKGNYGWLPVCRFYGRFTNRTLTKFLKNVKDFCATRSLPFWLPQPLGTGAPKNKYVMNVTYTTTKIGMLTKNFPSHRCTLNTRHKLKNGDLQNARSFDILQKFFRYFLIFFAWFFFAAVKVLD